MTDQEKDDSGVEPKPKSQQPSVTDPADPSAEDRVSVGESSADSEPVEPPPSEKLIAETHADESEPDAFESDAAQAEVGEPAEDRSAVKSRINMPLLAVGLLLLLAAGVAWAWWQVQGQLSQLRDTQNELAMTQQQLQAQTQAELVRLQQREQASESGWQTAVSELEQLVISSAQRMNRQANRGEQRWPLEEALTLTRLAQQRLQLDASARVAIGLLKAADKVLAGQDQAAVLPLRRTLAQDILALENTPATDINGAYFELEAIADAVRSVDWQARPVLPESIDDSAELADGFWQSLKQVVIVRRLDVPYQAPALQGDFELWRQQVLLLIEQTQLALLAQNQPLFDAAISQTLSRLSVMSSQVKTDVLTRKLEQLATAQLNPVWPDIQASIRAQEAYLAEQADADPEPESESEAETDATPASDTSEGQQ